MDKKTEAIVAVVGFLVSLFLWGFVDMTLWNWYVAPLGVIKLTFVHAIGLGIASTALTGMYSVSIIDFQLRESGVISHSVTERLMHGLFGGVILLFLGWVVHFFM